MAFRAYLIFILAMASLTEFSMAKKETLETMKPCGQFNYTVCPCGTSGAKVAVPIEMCYSENPLSGIKECEPCNNHLLNENHCVKYKSCETCLSGLKACLTCPPGRHGAFCEKDRLSNLHTSLNLTEKEKIKFPIGIRIPRGAQIKEHRLLRAMEACDYPSTLDTAEVDCKIWPSKILCQEICVHGYTLPEGITKEMSCLFEENKWSPSDFEECKPFVDCTIKLKSPGDVSCVANKMDAGPNCEVTCNEYEDIAEVPSTNYECDIDGNWNPPLPFCAEKGGDAQLVPAPKQKLHRR